MEHLLYLLPLYAVLGCLVGLCGGMLGIGGGTLLVPALYMSEKYFGTGEFDNSGVMLMAIATSMAIIIPTGISSAYSQIKRGAVRWDVVKIISCGLFMGVCIGIYIATKIDNNILRIIFACTLYVVSILTFFKKEAKTAHPIMLNPLIATPAGAGIGVFATLVGMGGAVLSIPYINIAGVPMRNAIATTSVLGVVVCVPAVIGFMINGAGNGDLFAHFNLWAWGMIVPFSVIMSPIGVRLSHTLPVKTLKIIFVGLLIIIATKMILT